MANIESENAIGQLKSLPSPADQLTALRHLKNQVIGHPDKKELLVQHGLIDSLTQTLNECITVFYKQDQRSGSYIEQSTPANASETQLREVQFQALTLLGSLAQGGPAFLQPLKAASIEQLLAACISPSSNPSRTVSVALKVALSLLNASEYNILHDGGGSGEQGRSWTGDGLHEAYHIILSQTSDSPATRTQVSIVCQLLRKTITTDQERDDLCSVGILDCLAALLASFYVHNHPHPSKAFNSLSDSLPAPPTLKILPEVIGAVNELIRGSKHRVAKFLLSPRLYEVLPFYNSQASLEPRIHQHAQYATYDINPTDLSVPWVHNGIQKTDTRFAKAFPALGAAQTNLRNQAFVDFAENEKSNSPPGTGIDSSVTPWLIHIMRTTPGLVRVRAAILLSTIAKTKYVCEAKSLTLALLVVPILLDTLRHSSIIGCASVANPLNDERSQALYEVPTALGSLTGDAPSLGSTLLKHIVEAGAIKEVCQYLKQTFTTIDNRAPSWSANPDDSYMEQDGSPTCVLGNRGVSAKVAYLFRCRRAGLALLANVAGSKPGEDKFRKALVDHGAMQCIMDSLTPLNNGSIAMLQSHGGKEKLDASVGNPTSVLIAACRAATAISRSIFLLRTSLIDAGIAKPILSLTQQSDIGTKVGATCVICNLLVECSPMRNEIIDAGAITTLCTQAHSSNLEVRSISLWALKHLVSSALAEIKRSVIEELGVEWLIQVIEGNNNLSQTTTNSPRHKGATSLSINAGSNALGERVSILHTPDDDDKMQEDSIEASPIFKDDNGIPLNLPPEEKSGLSENALKPFAKADSQRYIEFLSYVKSREEFERANEPMRRSQQLEAHALDIIRNIVCGPAQHELIDYVFSNAGSPRLYDLLAAKLQVQGSDVSSYPTTGPVDSLPLRTLDSALKTLCHIAAGAPRHRAQFITQTHILQLLLPLFQHPDAEIRATCCWICTNLMWVDDSSDILAAKERALMLKRFGFEGPIEELSKKPADGGKEQSQNVRERAASAKDCMIQATEGRLPRQHGSNATEGLGHVGAESSRR